VFFYLERCITSCKCLTGLETLFYTLYASARPFFNFIFLKP
jgi:hypothetical protein